MRFSEKDKQTREKAFHLLEVALNKKAFNPVILDVRGVSLLCDYFLLCSGESERQVKALHEEVINQSKKEHIAIHHTESDTSYHWILIDFYDVVVHIFLDEVRKFYDIEHLWREGKKIRLPKKNFLKK